MNARIALFLLPGLLVGCISRSSTELLETRLRHQEEILLEQQDELTATNNSLAELRRENDFLNRRLAEKSETILIPETIEAISRVEEIRIHKLMSGIRNSIENAGDSVLHLVVQPVDADGEIVKVAGKFNIELQPNQSGVIQANATQPVVTTVPVQESSSHWHRGLLVSGYQFEIPIGDFASSRNAIVTVRFRTADGREFSTSHRLGD